MINFVYIDTRSILISLVDGQVIVMTLSEMQIYVLFLINYFFYYMLFSVINQLDHKTKTNFFSFETEAKKYDT